MHLSLGKGLLPPRNALPQRKLEMGGSDLSQVGSMRLMYYLIDGPPVSRVPYAGYFLRLFLRFAAKDDHEKPAKAVHVMSMAPSVPS